MFGAIVAANIAACVDSWSWKDHEVVVRFRGRRINDGIEVARVSVSKAEADTEEGAGGQCQGESPQS